MALEGQDSGPSGMQESPGGHLFGIQGWTWNAPHPRSITFFLDNTAKICDQYGRPILRAVDEAGREVKFACEGPELLTGGVLDIRARPQYATHQQVIDCLRAEGFDWLSYEVKWKDKAGREQVSGRMPADRARVFQERKIKEGVDLIRMDRVVATAGWPQLPYEELKKLPELPPTPEEELVKILDPVLRKAALRITREAKEVKAKELVEASAE